MTAPSIRLTSHSFSSHRDRNPTHPTHIHTNTHIHIHPHTHNLTSKQQHILRVSLKSLPVASFVLFQHSGRPSQSLYTPSTYTASPIKSPHDRSKFPQANYTKNNSTYHHRRQNAHAQLAHRLPPRPLLQRHILRSWHQRPSRRRHKSLHRPRVTTDHSSTRLRLRP